METITFTTEQLEFLNFVVKDFEYQDDEERKMIESLEFKIFEAQEAIALRTLYGLTTQVRSIKDMPKVKIDPFDITDEELDLFNDNQLSLMEILDRYFHKDELNIYIDE